MVNLGHWLSDKLLTDLPSRPANCCVHHANGNGTNGHHLNGNSNGNGNGSHAGQLNLKAILTDEVARPILEQAASLTTTVELDVADKVIIRYVHK